MKGVDELPRRLTSKLNQLRDLNVKEVIVGNP